MNFNTAALIAVLSFNCLLAGAADITGGVFDSTTKKPLPGATLIIVGTNLGAVTDENGRYAIQDIDPGVYVLEISSLGFKRITREIRLEKKTSRIRIDFSLEESVAELDAIIVRGESEASVIEQEPIRVSAIDTKELRIQSIGAADVLKTTTGVVVRRSGGLGSTADVQLNGLSGQAVRIFYDGMPLEFLGGGFDLTNLPVSVIERVEVYKGVVPINIGTDALAGAINIVPKSLYTDLVEASYQFGSFNTHMASIIANKKISDRFAVSLNAFHNFSDNDFQMEGIPNKTVVDSIPDRFGNGFQLVFEDVPIDNARRFNNRHRSTFGELGIHLRDMNWADELSLYTTYSTRFDEDQHGFRIDAVAVGDANRSSNGFTHRLKYTKALFNNKLRFKYHGVFAHGEQSAEDASLFEYNWFGEVINELDELAGEISGSATRITVDRLSQAHRINTTYEFSNNHAIKFSNFYSRLEIEGEDELGLRVDIGGELIDPNEFPSTLITNISGLEWNGKWLKNQKLNTILFGKYYYYDANATDVQSTVRTDNLQLRTVNEETLGYGAGIKYSFTDDLFIRASFESAYRLPTDLELFGNFLGVFPNYEIRPEQSDNFNVGINWKKRCKNNFFIKTSINGFLINTEDLIWAQPFGQEGSRFENNRDTQTLGLEWSTEIRPDQYSRLVINITDQERTYQGFEASSQSQGATFIGTAFPNTPFFFYNLQLALGAKSLRQIYPNIQLYASLFHTQEFSITDIPANGDPLPQNLIPTQDEVNVGLGYTTDNEKLSSSVQVNNVLNSFDLFDNFRIPKPNRNIQLKITYKLL
ncbi:MAG: TonB-dependent receptor [Bacteroidota bacterium]